MAPGNVYRCNQPGWDIVSLHDQRRGIWMRRTDPNNLELCAGREGDDELLVIRASEHPPGFLDQLSSILDWGLHARAVNGLPQTSSELAESVAEGGDPDAG